jgi:thiol reductant ABC exporter CydD subunit
LPAPVDSRLLARARPVRLLLVADAALGVLAALLLLAQATLLARVVARSFEGASLAQVATPLALFVAVVAGRAAAAFGFELLGRRAATAVLTGLRLDIVGTRLREQPAALDRAESSEVATAAVAGVDALEPVFARYLPQAVAAVVVPVAVLALVVTIDPISAGIMLLTLPFVPLFMWLIGRATERQTQARWEALSRLSSHFLDVVRGLPTLRAFNRGDAQADRIEEVGERYRAATMRTLRLAFLSGTVLELAATLAVALVAVTIGVRLVQGSIGFEAALTVLVLAPELYAPIRSLAAQYHASADGIAVTERLLGLIGEQDMPRIGSGPAPNPGVEPVRLDGVSFAYPGSRVPVLAGVDLELRPGETVALVGESGAGKTTVAALILRLAEPTAGRVLVGAKHLAGYDADAWRAQLSWLPQEPTLVRGTVADNIRLGAPFADLDRVRDAARLAGADEFVHALPDRYDTRVGEGGRELSAGERRRIALARALLRDASLLVLDEPTANLDPEAAARVAEVIESLHGTRTVLLITHRHELAELADRVVRLERGRLEVEVAA